MNLRILVYVCVYLERDILHTYKFRLDVKVAWLNFGMDKFRFNSPSLDKGGSQTRQPGGAIPWKGVGKKRSWNQDWRIILIVDSASHTWDLLTFDHLCFVQLNFRWMRYSMIGWCDACYSVDAGLLQHHPKVRRIDSLCGVSPRLDIAGISSGWL